MRMTEARAGFYDQDMPDRDAPLTNPRMHLVETVSNGKPKPDALRALGVAMNYDMMDCELAPGEIRDFFESTVFPTLELALGARWEATGDPRSIVAAEGEFARRFKPIRLTLLEFTRPQVAQQMNMTTDEVLTSMADTFGSLYEQHEPYDSKHILQVFQAMRSAEQPTVEETSEHVVSARPELTVVDSSTAKVRRPRTAAVKPKQAATQPRPVSEEAREFEWEGDDDVSPSPDAIDIDDDEVTVAPRNVNAPNESTPAYGESSAAFIRARAAAELTQSSDPVRAYLKQIGKVALLKADEEIELAKRIEGGVYAAEKLRRLQESGQRIPMQLRRDLAWATRDGEAAKNHMIGANLRLVVSIAKRHTGQGMALLDIIQEGNIGLMHAVKMFDYAKGFKFSTYATWWIRQTISRAKADQGRTIRLPVHVGEQVTKLSRAQRDLAQELGREPTPEELGSEMGVTADKVIGMQQFSRQPLSLDEPIGEGPTTIGDFIGDTRGEDAIDTISAQDTRAALLAVIETLPEREADVIRLRYGIDNGEPQTLDEIGRKYKLSRERIRQIEKAAMQNLTAPNRVQALHERLD